MQKEKISRLYRPSQHSSILIDNLIKRKKSFYLRQTSHYTQILCDGVESVYKGSNSEKSFPSSQLWLFSVVKKEAIKFLNENPDFTPKTKMPTNLYNYDYNMDKGSITGTDITSAYWYIAHHQGIISEKTFQTALVPEYKVTKLAALAVLGRQMTYDEYERGIKKPQKLVLEIKHEGLKNIYRNIRYECYYHMGQLALLLGDDFFAYKTDAIYYRDTVKNRQIVYDYLDSLGFQYSQLDYEEPIELGK